MQRVESERVQSREYRECKGTELRGGSTMHDENTVRKYRVSTQRREYRGESAESVRVQRVECAESSESRVQRVLRVQGHRVERRE